MIVSEKFLSVMLAPPTPKKLGGGGGEWIPGGFEEKGCAWPCVEMSLDLQVAVS